MIFLISNLGLYIYMNYRRINIPAGSCSALVENEIIAKREKLKQALLNKERDSTGDMEILSGRLLGGKIPMGKIIPSPSQSEIIECFENSVYKTCSYLFQNVFCNHKTMEIESSNNHVSILEIEGEDEILEVRLRRLRGALKHPPREYYITVRDINGNFKQADSFIKITPSKDVRLLLDEFELAVGILRSILYQSLFCEDNIVSLQCTDNTIQILITNN